MAKRKRKMTWGPSNPLWRWQHQKANKSRVSSVKTRVIRVAKRATRKRRRYGGRLRKWFRRRDKRMPISAISGLATSVLAAPMPGWSTVLENVQAGAFDRAAQSFIASWTGVKLGGIGGQTTTEWDTQALNPFNFQSAPAWKVMLWTGIVAKVTKRFVGDPFSKVPFIGKYIKFS